MNAKQRVILWGGFILLLLTILIPHWKFGTVGDGGYHFLFLAPPVHQIGDNYLVHGKIDFIRLFMQLAFVSTLTAGLTFLFRDQHK